MGGRSGPSSRRILGSPRRSGTKGDQLSRTLETKGTEVAANVAFQTAAAANPVIGAVYVAYQAAQFTYPIVKKGVQEYERSGDAQKAIDKMAQETVRQVGKTILESSVSGVVGAAVDGAMKGVNITPDSTTATLVKAAITETINEVI
jgi:hypothetical protein